MLALLEGSSHWVGITMFSTSSISCPMKGMIYPYNAKGTNRAVFHMMMMYAMVTERESSSSRPRISAFVVASNEHTRTHESSDKYYEYRIHVYLL